MSTLVGFFTDFQQTAWLNQFFSKMAYTPPATLYLGLFTTKPSRTIIKEVPITQTLAGFADFVVDSAINTRISSPSHAFADADQSVIITGGAGWTKATYAIGSRIGAAADLGTSPAMVGAIGGTGSIVRGTGYARVPLPSGIFDLATGGCTQNNAPIALPAPTGDWGTIKALGIFDASTNGNMLAMIATTAPTVISAGDAARTLAAGALVISRT
jgi:hypothetical protein